jgi:hypothetical protein
MNYGCDFCGGWRAVTGTPTGHEQWCQCTGEYRMGVHELHNIIALLRVEVCQLRRQLEDAQAQVDAAQEEARHAEMERDENK